MDILCKLFWNGILSSHFIIPNQDNQNQFKIWYCVVITDWKHIIHILKKVFLYQDFERGLNQNIIVALLDWNFILKNNLCYLIEQHHIFTFLNQILWSFIMRLNKDVDIFYELCKSANTFLCFCTKQTCLTLNLDAKSNSANKYLFVWKQSFC